MEIARTRAIDAGLDDHGPSSEKRQSSRAAGHGKALGTLTPDSRP